MYQEGSKWRQWLMSACFWSVLLFGSDVAETDSGKQNFIHTVRSFKPHSGSLKAPHGSGSVPLSDGHALITGADQRQMVRVSL